MPESAWARWKRIAHRAAEFQASVLFLLLYFVGVVPMRLLGLGKSVEPKSETAGSTPRWSPRPATASDLPWARRQF